MGAFVASFIEYFGKLIIFAVLAFAGVMTGKKLRENKDAKSSTVRIQSGRK